MDAYHRFGYCFPRVSEIGLFEVRNKEILSLDAAKDFLDRPRKDVPIINL